MAAGAGLAITSSVAFPVIGTAMQPVENLVRQSINFKHPSRFMDINSAVRLWIRGQLDDVGMIFYLKIEGFLEDEILRIMESMKPLVPPSDMIRFVVKEAYTPELVKDLIAGEETPKLFTKELSKWGFNENVSNQYWAAHYDPLGKAEFEEMLHRLHPDQLKVEVEQKSITKEQAQELQFDEKFLDRMYRLKDVYPALRPRLRHVSYKSPTRIDIRRFEDFGIIDDKLLTYFNRNLGYAPWVAEMMTLWTKVANAMNDLKPLVQKGLINEDGVIKALLSEGANPQTAKKLAVRLMRFSKLEKAEKNRDLTVTYIERAFKIQFRDETESRKLLQQLGFDADEINFTIGLWQEEVKLDTFETRKDKNLTKADIEKRYKLDNGKERATRKAELVKIGYDVDEAEFLLSNIDKSIKGSTKRVR